MKARFIAHAGVALWEGKTEILIDPWLTDSTIKSPLLEGMGGETTIDFQIPRAKAVAEDFRPDAILISHFHVHHSPRRDILRLIGQSRHKTVLLLYPPMEEAENHIRTALGDLTNVQLVPCQSGQKITVGDVTVTAMNQPLTGHYAWYVEGSTGTVLHVSDSVINVDFTRRFANEWTKFFNLKPDLLFLSAGGNSLRRMGRERRYIYESSVLSPIEAAHLTQRIYPKAVSLIGLYNHSIWRNRQEYIRPVPIIEEEFEWAMEWLASDIKCVFVRPGHRFSINEPSPDITEFDTFIVK